MEKKCRKPKNKNLRCCKNTDDNEGPENRNDEAGSNIVCEEKPKNVQKCKKQMDKWMKKGENKVELKCGKLTAKWEKKKAKGRNPKKMKACVCTCLQFRTFMFIQRFQKFQNQS